MNGLPLPVKYALLGLLAGLIWLVAASTFDWPRDAAIPTLLAMTLGGAIGGYLRQRRGKTH